MSDNPPFTAVADEPLEARIVAWVLGDASAFEAAELERLCETRPELLVFRRRMRALHGLLTEAEATQPDLSWKLPPEKRRVLDEIFGAPELTPPTAKAKAGKAHRHFFWRAVTVAACLAGLLVAGVIFGAGSISMKSPRLAYEKIKNFSAPNGVERFETFTIDENSSPAAAGGRGDKRASLGIEYPEELIEGTPKPIRLPNLPGADGELYYQRSENANLSRRSDLMAARGTTLDRLSATAATDKKSVTDSPARRAEPSAPSSSMANAIAANTADGPAIAVPEEKPANQPFGTFGAFGDGDGDDFGGGWGGAGRKPAPPSKSTATIDGRLAVREKASQPAKPQASAGIVVNGGTAEEINGALTTLGGLGLKSGNLALRDQDADGFAQPGESTSRYSRLNEPPPPVQALPPMVQNGTRLNPTWEMQNQDRTAGVFSGDAGTAPAGSASPKLGDIPALGRWFDSSGSIEAKDAAGDASHAVAKLEGEPADTNFDMAKSFRDLQPATDESAGRDHHYLFTDSDSRSRAGQFKTPPPAIKSRPNLALQPQIQSQNAGIAGGSGDLTTETVSGGLKRDLSVPLAEREMLRRRSAEAASERLLTEDHFGYTNGKSAEAAEKFKAAKEQLPDDSRLEELQDNRAGYEALAAAAQAELSKQSGDRPAEGRKITDDGIRRQLSNADSALKVGKDWNRASPDDKDTLSQAIKKQEEAVEQSRKLLSQIVRSKGIVHYGQDAALQNEGMEEEHGTRTAIDNFTALETERMQLESMNKTLLKYDSDQLMSYAAGLDLPDNAVRTLYPQYLEKRTKLEQLKNQGLAQDHPALVEQTQELSAIKKQLDEGTVALRDTLKAKLDLADAKFERARQALAEKKGYTINNSIGRQDFEEAKKSFEMEQNKLQQMRIRKIEAEIRQKLRPPSIDPPPPVDPGTELSAETEPYSTFSLSISETSFKTAQAALAKGETPDPAGIRIEQFYNAMDYDDPSPSSGEPVAAMIEQSAHPLVPGRNLVRVALRTAATGRSASQPLRLTLLIDQSGSMVRDDRRQALGRALKELATLLTPNDHLTVVGFSLKPRLLADDLPGDQAGKLLGMINQDANEGGTNLELALSLAHQLAAARHQPGAQNRIVLFTDGAANLGNADPERLAETVKVMRQTGLSFDVAGIGTSELNDRLLAELARHGNGRFYVVDAATDEPNDFARQLAGAFRPAAENVKVQVRFNPRRVGGYKLIGFEEHRLNQEDFRNDTVDAAELAAEEAGVALYQVQPLPSGSGDLGEVSVRFRDTTTGRMVERSWSIPYDPSVPAFDQANPSLQLAGLAMLTAEKLRRGPMAAVIDFTRFTDSRATVRNFYPSARRVRELLEMIERIR